MRTNAAAIPPATAPLDAGHVALELLNRTIAAQIGLILEMQAPRTAITATDAMNLLCEHLGKLLSLVEPEQVRNALLGEIRRNLPGVMNRHVEARLTTPGGVFVGQPGMRAH